MTSATFSTSLEAQQAAALLEGYRFELGGHDARQWVSLWLEFYKPSWIRDAVVEALYQGRYKSVSVRQILDLWQRRSKPIRHVTHDFEAAVCREFGEVKIRAALPPAASSRQSLSHQSLHSQSLNRPGSNGQLTQGGIDAIQSIRHSSSSKRASAKRASSKQASASSTVSFNLAELAAAPGMEPLSVSTVPQAASEALSKAAPSKARSTSQAQPLNHQSQQQHSQGNAPEITQTAKGTEQQTPLPRNRPLDNKAWREFANYTTPTHAPKQPDPEETLRIQRQFNGVLYSSARAIQPFKPALPFSAQTLRRAKQKALAESL